MRALKARWLWICISIASIASVALKVVTRDREFVFERAKISVSKIALEIKRNFVINAHCSVVVHGSDGATIATANRVTFRSPISLWMRSIVQEVDVGDVAINIKHGAQLDPVTQMQTVGFCAQQLARLDLAKFTHGRVRLFTKQKEYDLKLERKAEQLWQLHSTTRAKTDVINIRKTDFGVEVGLADFELQRLKPLNVQIVVHKHDPVRVIANNANLSLNLLILTNGVKVDRSEFKTDGWNVGFTGFVSHGELSLNVPQVDLVAAPLGALVALQNLRFAGGKILDLKLRSADLSMEKWSAQGRYQDVAIAAHSIANASGTFSATPNQLDLNVQQASLRDVLLARVHAKVDLQSGVGDVKGEFAGPIERLNPYLPESYKAWIEQNRVIGTMRGSFAGPFDIKTGPIFAKTAISADLSHVQVGMHAPRFEDVAGRLTLGNGALLLRLNGHVGKSHAQLEIVANLARGMKLESCKARMDLVPGSHLNLPILEKVEVSKGNGALSLSCGSANACTAHVSLTDAALSLPKFAIDSPVGETKDASVNIQFDPKSKRWSSSEMCARFGALSLVGSFGAQSDLSNFTVESKWTSPTANGHARYEYQPHLVTLLFDADALDISKLLTSMPFDTKSLPALIEKGSRGVQAQISVKRLKLVSGVVMNACTADIRCTNAKCQHGALSCGIARRPLSLNVDPSSSVWTLKISDVGRLLMGLGLGERVQGGELVGKLRALDLARSRILSGKIEMENFHVLDKSAFWYLLLASPFPFTVPRSQDTVHFRQCDLDFALLPSSSTIRISRASLTGQSATISARGVLSGETIDLSGTVAPQVHVNHLSRVLYGKSGSNLLEAPFSITGSIRDPVMQIKAVSGLIRSTAKALPNLLASLGRGIFSGD